MFDRPAAPGRDDDAPQFTNAEHLGDLLVIRVDEFVPSISTTANKPGETSKAIRADVTVINPDGTPGTEYPDALLFGTVFVDQLKRSVGRSVCGVFELGEKKPGKNAPYRLADPTDAQEALAVKAMTGKPAPAAEPATAAAGGDDRPPWEK